MYNNVLDQIVLLLYILSGGGVAVVCFRPDEILNFRVSYGEQVVTMIGYSFILCCSRESS